jgi:hypothetical protein
MPAQAGIQESEQKQPILDLRFRGGDGEKPFRDTLESGNLCATMAPVWMPVFTGMTGSYDVKQKMCRIMRDEPPPYAEIGMSASEGNLRVFPIDRRSRVVVRPQCCRGLDAGTRRLLHDQIVPQSVRGLLS